MRLPMSACLPLATSAPGLPCPIPFRSSCPTLPHRHVSCCAALVAAGADVDARSGHCNGVFQDFTALLWAAQGGHANCCAALVAAGADPDALCKLESTALIQV